MSLLYYPVHFVHHSSCNNNIIMFLKILWKCNTDCCLVGDWPKNVAHKSLFFFFSRNKPPAENSWNCRWNLAFLMTIVFLCTFYIFPTFVHIIQNLNRWTSDKELRMQAKGVVWPDSSYLRMPHRKVEGRSYQMPYMPLFSCILSVFLDFLHDRNRDTG